MNGEWIKLPPIKMTWRDKLEHWLWIQKHRIRFWKARARYHLSKKGDAMIDEPDYDTGPHDEHDGRTANQRICHECNRETAGESCGFCGNDLCPMCFECGGGFCSDKHTQEQIDAYEDEAYPPKNFNEACERKRNRIARDELRKLGVLPPL